MDDVREVFIDETEWWDRVAMSLDLLEKKFGAKKVLVRSGDRTVQWVGNCPPPQGLAVEKPRAADATAYVFKEVSDVEILRRLSQMPDESEIELLVRPFIFYCPETVSLVGINLPEMPLADMLKKLFHNKGETS